MAKRTEQIFGIHAVTQMLETAPDRVINVWVQEAINSELVQGLQNEFNKLGLSVQITPRATMCRMTRNQNHQGVIIEVKPAKKKTDRDLEEILEQNKENNSLYLILDSVQDPHNLGACIRTAAATGVTAIIIPKDRAASLNETVRKVASGAVENVTVISVVNLVRAIKKIKEAGVWVVGAEGEAEESIYDMNLTVPTAIIMGGEGKGMRESVMKECDYVASLPLLGPIESLNVSVATGVILYEVIRQRQSK
ncbi:MAG: 23S rRNA (guanosine(2251)-2'-O)-methyltransferase RlmB [Pseudomonadota bacterium]